MARRRAPQRATYSKHVGHARGELYRKSLNRAHDAYASGFYLETIALVESLMADRLESVVSLLDGEPVRFVTVGQAIRGLEHRLAGVGGTDLPLFKAVIAWGDDRARWLHEFAKISTNQELEWDQRLLQAQEAADVGLELLKEVTAQASAVARAARSSLGPADGA